MAVRLPRYYTHGMDDRSTLRRVTLWFVGIVVGFKLWTILLVFVFMANWSVAWYMLLNHVAWLSGLVVTLWGPALFWYRLVQLRRRRSELLRSEWDLAEASKPEGRT